MARGDNFKGAKPENSGRKAGTPNKVTATLKDVILGALALVVMWRDEDWED